METVIPSTTVPDVPVVSAAAPVALPTVETPAASPGVNWWMIGLAALVALGLGYVIYQNTQKKIVTIK